jgi:hypothetical protein
MELDQVETVGISIILILIMAILVGLGIAIGTSEASSEAKMIQHSRLVQQCEVEGRQNNCLSNSVWYHGNGRCSCISRNRRIQWSLEDGND